MRRTAVVGNQQFAKRVEHEKLPQSRLAGERDAAGIADLPRDLLDRFRFVRAARETDARIRKPLEQTLCELDVSLQRPFAQWQEITGIRI